MLRKLTIRRTCPRCRTSYLPLATGYAGYCSIECWEETCEAHRRIAQGS